jgi:hypothetical protein
VESVRVEIAGSTFDVSRGGSPPEVWLNHYWRAVDTNRNADVMIGIRKGLLSARPAGQELFSGGTVWRLDQDGKSRRSGCSSTGTESGLTGRHDRLTALPLLSWWSTRGTRRINPGLILSRRPWASWSS